MDQNEIRAILKSARTIAVVGISDKPFRPSYGVAEYLIAAGYEILPVNPKLRSWQGLACYPNIKAIGRPIDIVDIFRRSDQVLPVVKEAIEMGVECIWMQLGVLHAGAARLAENAGIPVVMNRCIKIDHRSMIY